MFECHLSLGRDVTALQCVCFIVSCMCFDNVQMVHCNILSCCRCSCYICRFLKGTKRPISAVCDVAYVVFVFFSPPLTYIHTHHSSELSTLLYKSVVYILYSYSLQLTQLTMFYFWGQIFVLFGYVFVWLGTGLFC